MAVALKICGIVRAIDLRACMELGVDAVGLNLWASSPRAVTIERAAAMLADAGLAPGARPQSRPRIVGVFVDPAPRELARACETLALDAAQLHGNRSIDHYADVATPWIRVLRGNVDLDSLAPPKREPVWTLLDAAVRGYGGAGVRADWPWAAQAVLRAWPRPVWLAGGITPDNAAEAIGLVAPAGIDVASGVELGPGAPVGWKSRERIAALVSICGTLRP